MKKILYSIVCITLLSSCQENTPAEPTVSKEEQEKELAQKRFDSLGTQEVDEYPSFQECESITTKDEKLKCFTDNLSKLYKEALNSQKLAIGDALNDTIKVSLLIDNKGIISIKEINSSDRTKELLPDLENLLKEETLKFKPIIAAKKNQIEVTTECVLPLVINVK